MGRKDEFHNSRIAQTDGYPSDWDMRGTVFLRPPSQELVKVGNIVSSQPNINEHTVQDLSKKLSVELPPVSLWHNELGYHVLDGNHRVNAALVRGESHILANVYRAPTKEGN
jgi:hypothetical protein